MKKTIKINVVGFWTGFDKKSWFIMELLRKHYEVEFSDKPDFLFYSLYDNEFEKYDNCVKILYTGENIIPDFNQCDYGIGFDYLEFGDRYFRMYDFMPNKSINDRSDVTDDFVNRRFCNFIYSNATSGEGAILRQEFCKKLMEYKHVDCPGRVLHNMDTDELSSRNGKDWRKSKNEFLKKYKFTIAFENSLSNGYTTEKLFNPLESFSVPIYYGNPLVVRDVNPKSFINCNDYNNDFDAIIERIKYLDTHDDEYLAMLREKPMFSHFDFNRDDKLEKWLCSIIEKGNKPFNKDPRDWSSTPYINTIHKLTKDNEILKSSVDVIKLIQGVKEFKSYLDKHLVMEKNLVQGIDEASRNIHDKLKKNYKKTRKYFNVILISQLLIFCMIGYILFVS